MKKEDLRIGNLVIDEGGDILPIYTLGENVCFHNKSIFSEYNTIKGVSVTKESLLQFNEISFNWDKYNFMCGMVRYWIDLDKKRFQGKSISIIAEYDTIQLGITTIDYIHELQNLYFSLNKKDLTIKNI